MVILLGYLESLFIHGQDAFDLKSVDICYQKIEPNLDAIIQTMSIERVRRLNQWNAIERDRTVEIRLSNAIKSQSNGQILGNYTIGSIEIWLRSI